MINESIIWFIDYSIFIYYCFFFYFLIIGLLMTAVQHFIYLLILLDLLVLLNIVILAIFTLLTGDTFGYCFALILFAVAAADTAIGLGLFIVYFRILNSPAVS